MVHQVSFFTFLQQESFQDMLLPLYRKLGTMIGLSRKSNAGFVLLLNGLLDGACLYAKSSIFTELFFGLRRRHKKNTWILHLAVHLCSSHIQEFMHLLRENQKNDDDDADDNNNAELSESASKRVVRFASTAVRLVASFYGLLVLVYKFAYLVELSRYYSPMHHVLGLSFTSTSDESNDAALGNNADLTAPKLSVLLDSLITAITLALLIRKGSEWWHTIGKHEFASSVKWDLKSKGKGIPYPLLIDRNGEITKYHNRNS